MKLIVLRSMKRGSSATAQSLFPFWSRLTARRERVVIWFCRPMCQSSWEKRMRKHMSVLENRSLLVAQKNMDMRPWIKVTYFRFTFFFHSFHRTFLGGHSDPCSYLSLTRRTLQWPAEKRIQPVDPFRFCVCERGFYAEYFPFFVLCSFDLAQI